MKIIKIVNRLLHKKAKIYRYKDHIIVQIGLYDEVIDIKESDAKVGKFIKDLLK